MLPVAPLLMRAGAPASFSIIQRWHVGGNGAWNRLTADPVNHRLYVTRGDRIVVVNTLTGKQAGEVGGAKSIRTVCLSPNGQTGYFTDAGSGSVRVFDRGTLRLGASIPTGADPDAAVLDAGTNTLVVLNDRSESAALIDTTTERAVATVALPGRPASAVSDGQGVTFVTINDSAEIARIDLRNRKVLGTWPIPGCSGASGLANDATEHRVYAVCENNRLFALDARNGQTLTSVELPDGTREVAFDPTRKLLFAASGGGTLKIFETGHSSRRLAALQTVKTMAGARTMAVDSSTGQVYLDTAEFGLRTGETSEELRFRPTPVPGSFVVLVVAD